MGLETIAFVAPLLGVALFLALEEREATARTRSRLLGIGAIQAINSATAIALSLALLAPLVFLSAPYQLFSFSEWQVPIWLSFLTSILCLDFFSYLSHRLHHKIPLLWRIHRLHHSDRRVDVFTSLLHHPLEVISGFIGIVVFAVVFDVPLIALVTYSILLGVHAAFTHMNRDLPAKIDRYARWLVVTPSFHRIHHSADLREGNSNFGAVFVYWDYLFRTVTVSRPAEKVVFGISKVQSPPSDSIGSYLSNPLT
jgi:sterol desaturase/sphingolipid hydroxylase (fatty acid hydroxylase superfamily)